MLLIVGDFKIIINKELFFSEPYFPILEFMKVALSWVHNDENTPMLYNSVETEENPLISFTKVTDSWNIFRLGKNTTVICVFQKKNWLQQLLNLNKI